MSNILKIKIEKAVEVGDYIVLDYDITGGAYHLDLKIAYVAQGDRYGGGDFEVQNNVREDLVMFPEFFDKDYNQDGLFDLRIDEINNIIYIESTKDDGVFSGLTYSSPNNTLLPTILGDIPTENELSFTLDAIPTNGDTITFDYYPFFPETGTVSTATMTFKNTPSGVNDVQIGSDVETTYKNLEETFNDVYNSIGQFNTYLSTDENSDIDAVNIKASNGSVFNNVAVSGTDVNVDAAQRSQADPYINNIIFTQSPRFIYSPSSLYLKRVRFTFKLLVNIAVDPSKLIFDIKRNDVVAVTVKKYFVGVAGGIPEYDVVIGADVNETMSNLYNSMVTYNSNSMASYTLDNNIIHIDIFDETDSTISIDVRNNSENIPFYGPVIDGGAEGFDSTEYNVVKWEGIRNRFAEEYNTIGDDDLTTWNVTKQLLTPNQRQTYLDISPLVSDGFLSDISSYQTNTPVKVLPPNTSKWVEVYVKNKLVDTSRDTKRVSYFALNGWTDQYHNLPNILLSGRETITESGKPMHIYRRSLHRGVWSRIFYQTTNVDPDVDMFDPHYSKNVTGIRGNVLLNTEFVKSLYVPWKSSTEEWVSYIQINFGYSRSQFPSAGKSSSDSQASDIAGRPSTDLTISKERIIIDIIDDCKKYPIVQVAFKNRFGVLETLSFGMISKRSLKTDRDMNKYSVVDLNGTLNRYKHSNRNANVSGKEEYVLNTGFVPEYMNEPYTDLFMSDEVYLKDADMTYFVPANLLDTDFNKMSKVNDKLINYTFRFQASHNKNYDLI